MYVKIIGAIIVSAVWLQGYHLVQRYEHMPLTGTSAHAVKQAQAGIANVR